MAVKLRVDWGAVLNGAVVTVVLVIPTLVVIQVANAVFDIPDRSNFWFFGYALVFAEMALGGARAARRRPEAPSIHGAFAALAAYAPVLTIVGAIGVATADSLSQVVQVFVAVLFGALTFASAGIFGGLLATRPGRRRRRGVPGRRPAS